MAKSRKPIDTQEHERPEDMVESPGLAEEAARSLEDAADSHASLEGYYAINNEPEQAAEDIPDEVNEGLPAQPEDTNAKGKGA
jgi:hypothetical protein